MTIKIDITPPTLILNKQEREHLKKELDKIYPELRKQAEKDIEKLLDKQIKEWNKLQEKEAKRMYAEEPTRIETITYNYAEAYEKYNIKEQMYINQLKELLHLPMITEIVVMQDTGLHIRGLITVKEDILINIIKQLRKICSTIDVNIQEDSISLIAYFKEEYKTMS